MENILFVTITSIVTSGIGISFWVWVNETYMTERFVKKRIHKNPRKMTFVVDDEGHEYKVTCSISGSVSLTTWIDKKTKTVTHYNLHGQFEKICKQNQELDTEVKALLEHIKAVVISGTMANRKQKVLKEVNGMK